MRDPLGKSITLLALVLVLLLTACAGEPDGPTYADADFLFEPDRLLSVAIEMEPADWDELRFQSRNILEIFGESCATGPAGSPFTYVSATVTVEGEVVEKVGLRKKGFLGSLDEDKPSLKIDFDQYVAGQTLSGLEQMTLNNAKQDPSYLNQCLGYRLFEKAGVPAPRCNYAQVSVNGEPIGVYVHVESVKKPFLQRHFASDEGNLYEGTLSDFRDGWTATFERKTNTSSPDSEDRSDILSIVDALAADDSALVDALEQQIDLDRFLDFWAIETMIGHWDGYAGNNNNFFLYGDPDSGKTTFLPWGTDQLFGSGSIGSIGSIDPGLTRSALTRRLYLHDASRERYLARYREILDTVWDDGDLLAEIDRMQALISPAIPTDQTQAFDDAVTGLRTTIDGREQALRDGLDAAGPGDADNLADPLCFDRTGALTATFSTTYGGTATNVSLSITIDGSPVTLTSTASAAGPSDDTEGESVLYMAGQDVQGRNVVIFVSMPDAVARPGKLAVGEAGVESAILFFAAGGQNVEKVYFLSGTVTLDAAGATPGAPWQGSVDLIAWDTPFF